MTFSFVLAKFSFFSMPCGCLPAFLVLASVLAFFSYLSLQKRRRLLSELATQLGLQFTPSPGSALFKQYAALQPFGQGSSRNATNLLSGQKGDIYWEIFDYRYTTGSGDNQSTSHFGVVAARVPMNFPATRIRPEGFFDKFKEALGFPDINFESEAFSRRFHVACADRQRAYDLIHPKLIEFLMSLPPVDWQISGPVILLYRSGTQKPSDITEAMNRITQFVGLVPDYVRQDLRRPV